MSETERLAGHRLANGVTCWCGAEHWRSPQSDAVEAAFAELEQHRNALQADADEFSVGRAIGVGEAIDVLRGVLGDHPCSGRFCRTCADAAQDPR